MKLSSTYNIKMFPTHEIYRGLHVTIVSYTFYIVRVKILRTIIGFVNKYTRSSAASILKFINIVFIWFLSINAKKHVLLI